MNEIGALPPLGSVRRMRVDDLDQVSAVCMAAFNHSIAGTLSALGVETFGTIASAESFGRRLTGDSVILVHERDGVIDGVAELKQRRHVAMLFVVPACQRQGIGGALMRALLQHAHGEVVTVSASLSSVPAYERYGFACSGAIAESSGLVYLPMEKWLP